MRYEINLAQQNGTAFYDGQHHPRWVHFAKVTLSTNTNNAEAIDAARLFSERFAGFKVTLTHWRATGSEVAFSKDEWLSDDHNPAFNVPDGKAQELDAARRSQAFYEMDNARD